MITNQEENTVIITKESQSLVEFVKQLEADYHKFKHQNIIVNIANLIEVNSDNTSEFLGISNRHRATKKSFVIVSDEIDLDNLLDDLIVVPTMQEAYDIIEMEDIERHLGL